jgi:beta-N-acetylhexosaminidase
MDGVVRRGCASMRRPASWILVICLLLGEAGSANALPRQGHGQPAVDTALPASTAADAVLQRLTREQKVAQVMMVAFAGPAPTPDVREMVGRYGVGGVILFQDNIGALTPQQVLDLTTELQGLATADAAGIPLLIAVDQEGGPVNRANTGTTILPGNMALGAAASALLTYEAARAVGRELRAMGINMNLAPVVDVNSNPRNPVIGVRSFGADPDLVGRLGAAAVRGYQDGGVLAVAKHFPGHGDTDVDSHLDLPVIRHSLERLETVEFPPFRAAISTGAAGVMTAHVAVPTLDPDSERPATLSAPTLTRLRDMLGEDGLIISDDLEMGAIVARYHTAEAAVATFVAGADILLFRRDAAEQRRAHALLLAALNAGAISMERLDASVRRILLAKERLGLLGASAASDTVPDVSVVGSPEHRALAMEVAGRAVTLLRDPAGLLPLSLDGQALCVVSPRWQAMASVEIVSGAPEFPATLGDAIRARAPSATAVQIALRPTAAERSAALGCVSRASIVVFGTYNLHDYPEQAALLRDVAATGRPLVVVALRLPYDLGAAPEGATALAIYSSRPVALDAAAAALFGQRPISGRLPVPVEPLYPAGFGLDLG